MMTHNDIVLARRFIEHVADRVNRGSLVTNDLQKDLLTYSQRLLREVDRLRSAGTNETGTSEAGTAAQVSEASESVAAERATAEPERTTESIDEPDDEPSVEPAEPDDKPPLMIDVRTVIDRIIQTVHDIGQARKEGHKPDLEMTLALLSGWVTGYAEAMAQAREDVS